MLSQSCPEYKTVVSGIGPIRRSHQTVVIGTIHKPVMSGIEDSHVRNKTCETVMSGIQDSHVHARQSCPGSGARLTCSSSSDTACEQVSESEEEVDDDLTQTESDEDEVKPNP